MEINQANLLRALLFGIPGIVFLTKATISHTRIKEEFDDEVPPTVIVQYICGAVFSLIGFIGLITSFY